MRHLLTAAVVVAGLSLSGMAQNGNAQKTHPFKVKPSNVDAKVKKPGKGKGAGAGPAKTPGSTAAASNAKDLQNIEHETAKAAVASRTTKRTSGAVLKPAKDKPNPKISFNGGAGKGGGMTRQSSNPYKGRLKQKGSHH